MGAEKYKMSLWMFYDSIIAYPCLALCRFIRDLLKMQEREIPWRIVGFVLQLMLVILILFLSRWLAQRTIHAWRDFSEKEMWRRYLILAGMAMGVIALSGLLMEIFL